MKGAPPAVHIADYMDKGITSTLGVQIVCTLSRSSMSMMITGKRDIHLDGAHAKFLNWRRVVRTDVHDCRETQESMKDTKSVKHYNSGYKIVHWPERSQPYTIWKGNSVIHFCTTEEEAKLWLGSDGR